MERMACLYVILSDCAAQSYKRLVVGWQVAGDQVAGGLLHRHPGRLGGAVEKREDCGGNFPRVV
jgi:hypothetical protein